MMGGMRSYGEFCNEANPLWKRAIWSATSRVYNFVTRKMFVEVIMVDPDFVTTDEFKKLPKDEVEKIRRIVTPLVIKRVEEDPSFASTPTFAMFAPPELRRKYPEAGADFGFFDAKKVNEEHSFSKSICIRDRVVVSENDVHIIEGLVVGRRFKKYRNSSSSRWRDSSSSRWIYQIKSTWRWTKNGTRKYDDKDASPLYVSEELVLPMDEYLRSKIVTNPLFQATKMFRECASPELKSEHPEAGADFGFFDAQANEGKIGDWLKGGRRKIANKVRMVAADISVKQILEEIPTAKVLWIRPYSSMRHFHTPTPNAFEIAFRLQMWSEEYILTYTTFSDGSDLYRTGQFPMSISHEPWDCELLHDALLEPKFVTGQLSRDPSLYPGYIAVMGDQWKRVLGELPPEAGSDFGFFDTKKT